MKFRHLALKNVKGNWHQYIAFFLSCVFSVMIFYLFASFIYHPDVVSGHIKGGDKVRYALLACEYIIMIFSFFFVLYSESAFVKSRKKEFGLLSLFGMTAGQIRKLVFYENMLIAVLAILTGLVFGSLFSKLFLMAMSAMLQVSSPIGFQIVGKAVLYTVVGFLALFLVITVYSLFRIGKSEIIELLKAAHKPKSLPVFSRWLSVFAAVTLLVGYGLAYFSEISTVVIFMFPVLGLVIVGTYFLFTQGSVAFFRSLQKRKSIFYKRTNLITLSQLIFKMKDNARVLFMVSILSAVVMTAAGFLYIFFQGSVNNVLVSHPQTISYTEQGLHSHNVIQPKKIDSILAKDDVGMKYKTRTTAVPVSAHIFGPKSDTARVALVPEHEYNQIVKKSGKSAPVHVKNGHAVFAVAHGSGGQLLSSLEDKNIVQTKVAGEKVHFNMDQVRSDAVLTWPEKAYGNIIVNDQQYKQLTAGIPDKDKIVNYGYELNNWASTQKTVEKIQAQIPKDQQGAFVSRVELYQNIKQVGSLTMFIGLFVSLLFFIAAGSLIYFKLFAELEEDQLQYRALRRIGITNGEIKKIVSRQIAMIFFIPFVVGGVHALFAFKMFKNLDAFGDVWAYGGIVIGIFFVMQLIYFFITRQSYIRRIIE